MRTERIAISLKPLWLGKLALTGLEGLERLLVDRLERLLLELAVARAGQDAVVAGTRQVDLDHLLDPPWTGGHDHDAVGEEDRLLQIVGDEEHGLPGKVVELEKMLVHDASGQRVERAEGLVEEQHLRV